MASSDLRRLWKLHRIDAAILEIRNRAAALNVGKKASAEIESLSQQLAASDYKRLHAEQQDLELQQKSVEDKIAKYDGQLYGGKVVNPREVENIEKEIVILKRQKEELESRLLEIWDLLPPAKSKADELEKSLATKKQELADVQRNALSQKGKLEADFKARSAERPEAAKDQNPSLLAKYEAIRKSHQGIGMAEVIVKKGQCGACGTILPERTLQGLKDDKTMTCESCHRILYYTEGVV